MRKTIAATLFAVASTMAFSTAAHAVDQSSNVFATLQAGTLGAGLNLGYQFSPYFDIRANVNGLSYSGNYDLNDVKYEGNVRLLTAGLLADYYPFANGFRLTAGAYYNGNRATATGHATSDYNGIDLNGYGYQDASVEYQKFAPYVGLGYQTNDEDSNWMFTADVGVLYQGKAKVNLNTRCYNASVCSSLASQINDKTDDQRQDIQDGADKLKFYPVVSFGVGYRF